MERFESVNKRETEAIKRNEGREIIIDDQKATGEELAERKDGLSPEELTANREKYPDLYAIIDNIDFDYLREEYAATARQSGINPNTFNFLGIDHLNPRVESELRRRILPRNMPLPRPRGSYNVEKNVISFNWAMMDSAPMTNDDMRWLLPFYVLKVLTHEEGHAVSKSICADTHLGYANQEVRQTGYQQSTEKLALRGKSVSKEKKLESFNEGVIEKLSQELLMRYVKSGRDKNFDPETANKFIQWHGEHTELKSYPAEVLLVESFISLVAGATSIPEETVWRGVIRGAFEGNVFPDPEFRKLLNEAAGFDLVERIASGARSNRGYLLGLQSDIEERVQYLRQSQNATTKQQLTAAWNQLTSR